ncbi:MAG: FtsW/RodA/SpoVE family cell cycle protein [Bacilli bacterium]
MKNNRKYSDLYITICVVLLAILSCVMIFSTWSITSVVFGESSSFGILAKQLVIIFLSFGTYFVMMHIQYNFFKKYAYIFYLIAVVLLILVFFFPKVNDSHSWIPLPFIGLQPSEFAKLALIISVAKYYDNIIRKKIKMDYSTWFFIPLLPILIVLLAIFLQPDPGTTLIIILFLFVMLFATGFKFRYVLKSFIKFVPLITVVLVITFIVNVIYDGAVINYFLSSQARMISRIADFKDPCSKIIGSGFQICNSLIAINSGGITGKGLGGSTQKYLYVPEAHTDGIFAITGEELGLVATLFIMLLYAVIIFRIIYYAKKTDSIFAYLVCIGIAFMYLAHIFINIAGILNIIPFTGVPLPFYSYGGTFSIICFASLGLIQSIAISVNRERVE